MACSMSSANYMTKFRSSSSSESGDSRDMRSSWDMYVDDFIATSYGMEEDDSSEIFSGSESVSMVSYEAWSVPQNCNEAKFVDHDLEDTASSPAKSPTVNDFNDLFNMSQTLDAISFSKEKGKTFQETNEIMGSLLETELRKKGLCLVPLSMAVNCLATNNI